MRVRDLEPSHSGRSESVVWVRRERAVRARGATAAHLKFAAESRRAADGKSHVYLGVGLAQINSQINSAAAKSAGADQRQLIVDDVYRAIDRARQLENADRCVRSRPISSPPPDTGSTAAVAAAASPKCLHDEHGERCFKPNCPKETTNGGPTTVPVESGPVLFPQRHGDEEVFMPMGVTAESVGTGLLTRRLAILAEAKELLADAGVPHEHYTIASAYSDLAGWAGLHSSCDQQITMNLVNDFDVADMVGTLSHELSHEDCPEHDIDFEEAERAKLVSVNRCQMPSAPCATML